MKLSNPIVTKRLLLRALESGDAHGPYAKWMRDEEVLRYIEARFRDRDAKSLSAYIDRMNSSPDNLFLGILENKTSRHIGNIKIGPINPNHHRAHIGVIIGERDKWGKGYASEAIEALSEYAFRDLGLHRVEAGCYGRNHASVKAFERAGFIVEGNFAWYWRTGGEWDDQVWMVRFKTL